MSNQITHNMYTTQEAQRQAVVTPVLEYLRSKAGWRYETSEIYEDERAQRAASTITELADYIESLPIHDERIERLVTIGRPLVFDDVLCLDPEGEADRRIGRIGYDSPSSHDAALRELLALLASDVTDRTGRLQCAHGELVATGVHADCKLRQTETISRELRGAL